jgi:signal transduction histidine kinase
LGDLGHQLDIESGESYAVAPHAQAPWNFGVRLEHLANVAHELRSPVQAMLGYLEIMRDEIGNELDDEHRRMFDRMNINAYDLAQTVENIMEFAANNSVREDNLEELKIGELIEEISPALAAAADSKGLQLLFDLADAPATVRSQPRAIKSILANLALNAIKFTAQGQVTISVRALTAHELGAAVEITVSDTGPGIDPALLTRAFEPGVQLSNTSIRRHRGTGLGLAVVHRHVKALGATLRVVAAVGMGSTFTVTIPAD